MALRQTGGQVNPGLTEVVFEVPNIHATYGALKGQGVVFSQTPRAVTSNQTMELFASDSPTLTGTFSP